MPVGNLLLPFIVLEFRAPILAGRYDWDLPGTAIRDVKISFFPAVCVIAGYGTPRSSFRREFPGLGRALPIHSHLPRLRQVAAPRRDQKKQQNQRPEVHAILFHPGTLGVWASAEFRENRARHGRH